ncbi:hypothetical protein T484DRAFT_1952072 [Baffinella frigidus]|nr:hypothetical protein T484DRAFT_1952072 [Cryptophyta sp. CCMP2293]
MAGLSRDILKWLQSLDLSYSVKNVRRDFANGFLVAEIFSRYFPHEIQMHSFDNGLGLPRKLGNWSLLEKFFERKRVPISRILIDNVIHCKGEAAIPLLETIYTCLTSKKVYSVRPTNDDELIPPFARNTASFVIKENIRDSELATNLQDDDTTKHRTAALLQEHENTLRNERVSEPGRFTGPASPNRSNQRVLPRPMPKEEETGRVEFKEVKLRTVDRNISQLRSSRDGNGSSLPQGSEGGGGEGGDGVLGRLQSNGVQNALALVKPITTVLNEIVAQALDPRELKLLDQNKDKIVSLVDRLVSSKIAADVAQRVLEAIRKQCEELMQSLLNSPKEFWRLFAIFANVLSLPETSPCYSSVLGLLCEIGTKMTEKDAFVACGLFGEYGLPKLVPILKAKPSKRKGLLWMTYCFCEASMHLSVIKALQDALDDMGCFLQCIVILMHQEEGFSEESEDLLDLYIYYAMTGLGHQSASLRASALSMLVLVAEQSPLLVMPMLEKLEAMRDDGWWEVSAQLLRVCAALLAQEDLSPREAECETVRNLARDVLRASQSPLVRKIGVSCLAPCLKRHGGALMEDYVAALQALNERDFSAVMATDHHHQILGNSLSHMPIISPIHALPPLLVAETLARKIEESQLENLENEHVHVLLEVLAVPFDAQDEATCAGWLAVFKKLELHVYVALADQELADNIVAVLHRWITYFPPKSAESHDVLATFSTLAKSLKLVFNPENNPNDPAPDVCKRAAFGLVRHLRNSGDVYTAAVEKALAELSDPIVAEALNAHAPPAEGA